MSFAFDVLKEVAQRDEVVMALAVVTSPTFGTPAEFDAAGL
jgi:hypothetical protein